MTINWGKKILLFYLGFVALIITLVWKSSMVKINLVSEDYYAQEIGFQKKLDAEKATAGLAVKPVVTLTPDDILIFFPADLAGQPISADLQLYNAADAAFDKKFSNLQAREGKIRIARSGIPPKAFTAKLSWKCGEQSYYQESSLNMAAQ